ncbi:ABC transporter substrate-binding protein [Bacillus sp. Marseille-P3800]|uniref:ABC transporter substrate-binding protein n=1 Tax=Bacillus sp. Marseille-P3800 TaxID=2014782 RepID=UPI000C06FD9F|nr:ABC transporter substrate-binding protein [Bacillus sp. Marseille-P3800]
MKKFLKPRYYLAPTLVAALALAACSDNGDGGSSEGTGGGDSGNGGETDDLIYNEDGIYSIDDFEPTKGEEGEAIDGGTLSVASVSSAEFEGTLNPVFYMSGFDADVIEIFHNYIFTWDEAFNYTDDGIGQIEWSDDYLSATVTIRDDVTWHDGEPLTIDDWTYAYEIIAHPDYTGQRYGSNIAVIEGVTEYQAGEADEISGFNIVDDHTVEVTFATASPATLAGGLWSYPYPRHVWEDIPVDEQAEHENTRVNPIGIGPFKVESIVPGESVTYSAYEDYWQGAPQLDGIDFQVYNPDVIGQAMQSGAVDLVLNYPQTQFADHAHMTNLDWVGRIDRSFSYIGFKLGTWEDGENVPDPDAKMADPDLRRAMAMAIDNDTLGIEMYNGLRYAANTIIPPYHALYHDETNEGIPFDVDAANQLLDDAGYEYIGDFRGTPDGDDLTISFAAMSGDATAEAVTQFQIQSWEEIGLNVEMLEGQTHEFNSFYDRVEEDDPEIDVYTAAWGVGSNVDPDGLWGPTSPSNYTRYTDETAQDIIERGQSVEAFDVDYRQDVYNEWQEYFNEVAPAVAQQYRIAPTPMNQRVNGYSIEVGNNDYGYHTIYLSEETPAVHGE